MPEVTYPNLGLKAGYAIGENGWGDAMTANMKLLSIIVQGGAIDKVAALPGAPVEGDVVILDETNVANPNDIAAYIEGVWEYVTPQEGWLIYNQTASYYEQFGGAVWAELETGGASTLDALTDVDTTTTPPTDGQALVWDDGLSLWVPGDVEAGGGDAGATSIALTPLPAFQNGWVNFDAGFMPLTIIKTGRIVTINALLKNGVNNTVAFTLPVGWRPPATITSAGHSNTGHNNTRVEATGAVNLSADATFGYIDISFIVPEADAHNGAGFTSLSTVVDAAYTVLGTEGYVLFDRATAQVVTLPTTVPVGFQISGHQQGVGTVSLAAGAGAAIRSADGLLNTRVRYAAFTATKITATDWALTGDLA